MNKRIVAYFSASGLTAQCAKELARVTGADLYEIKPETPYMKADLDWRDAHSRSTIEMRDPSSRPAIADNDANIVSYDIVFLGFPIWWYVAPTIINTFLESYDFSGKTIVPFATSGGSGFGKTLEALQPSASAAALWKDGKLLNGNPSDAALGIWIESLNLNLS